MRLLEIPDDPRLHAMLDQWKIKLKIARIHNTTPGADEPVLKDSDLDPVRVAYYDDE
jgi:hypothetical protein